MYVLLWSITCGCVLGVAKLFLWTMVGKQTGKPFSVDKEDI